MPNDQADANPRTSGGSADTAAKKVSPEEQLKQLDSSTSGLSSDDAKKRLEKYGPNAIVAKEESLLRKLLGFFWGPIPWMIEVAAVLSLLVRHWTDFAIIMVLLIYNAAIGFWQERKAASALAALKKGLAPKAHVKRDGDWSSVDAADLVPGDIVRIRLGEIVPADVTLIEGTYISIDQAALTGESLPVSKKVGDTAYSSSIAKQGEMVALVTGTGANTFFGRTAKLVAGAGAKSHCQEAVMRIGDFLIVMAIGLSILLIGFELYRDIVVQENWQWDDIVDILHFVLILVIASIPVAMPAVLSVTMALGALALSKKKAIVSRLEGIEEMAGVDILCSDKTGTLTKNELTLGDPVVFGGASADACVLGGALASKKEDDDAIDLAVIRGVKNPADLDGYTQTAFTPFDPVSKRTEATVTDADGHSLKYAKGAPQVIIDMCNLDADASAKANAAVDDMAGRGFRALGVAESQDDGQSWSFLGILPLFDPPRDDSKETIRRAREHGLEVKMVTGDDVAIASEIAGQLGMGTHIQAATDLFTKGTDPSHLPEQAARAVERAEGFARVFPEHKFGIVKALQDRGHIVAMTGDGVNDSPALKQADCGIAVSGATDAARAAAALILTAPGLSVIITAIEQARQIFERIMSYTIYRIAMTIDIMFVVVLATIFFDLRPLTAVMIIALALLDDIPIMAIAYDNTRIEAKPLRWQMHRVLLSSAVMGMLAVAQSFGLLLIGLGWMRDPALQSWISIDQAQLQTLLFLQLVAGGHLLLFVTRTRRLFFTPPFPSLPLFGAILGTQVFAVLMCGFGWLVPALPWTLIGLVWIYVIVWMFILDAAKIGFYRFLENRTERHRRLLRTIEQPLHPHAAP
ncbi:MAG: plasma-membrane proton-efflux P-type ATPase [Alphaproteobacteria bacterium]|nr:plasma-membrane proton-efflux P-type ATPase [Alphaproteobacteria bacterium]